MSIYSYIERFCVGGKKATLSEQGGCLVRMVHADRVAKARQEGISKQEVERLSLLYRALADPTRLRIVLALATGEMCVCDLAAFLTVSESAVSHQLRHLRDLALVKNRRQGQVLYYALDDHHVSDLLAIGLEHLREPK
jgi:DNA-binding transcriptional ArsR family regulator